MSPLGGPLSTRTVPKPWGEELIWAETELYVGKILRIKAGHALSLQYHERKDEVIHVLSGQMRYRFGADAKALEERVLGPGEGFRNRPGMVHQMEAITDCEVLEASTPHLDDVVRLTDRYGRSGTSAP
jgi:mannose-6-phosphate isomerase